MIEAIKRIGEYIIEKEGITDLTEDSFLKGICRSLPETKTNNKNRNKPFNQYVVFLNFNTQTKKIELDFETINAEGKDSGREYLWVGNNSGRKEQIFFTTDNPVYLFTKTLSNIKKRLNGNLKSDLQQIIEEFFIDMDDNYIINPSKFDFFEKKVESIKDKTFSIKNDVTTLNSKKDISNTIIELKKICKELDIKCNFSSSDNINDIKAGIKIKCDELLESDIEGRLIIRYQNDILKRMKPQGNKRESLLSDDFLGSKSLSKDNVSIYTVKLNGKHLVNRQEYTDRIYNEKISCLFDKDNKNYKTNLESDGICSICGELKATTSNTTNIDFKFYNNDKLGFSSNLDGKFTKNYNICKNCYQYLMIAENFIGGLVSPNLRTRIGGLNAYIIPHFVYKVDELDINKFSEDIQSSTNSIISLKSLEDFHKKLEDFREYEAEKNNFIINYLFYQKSKSEFKILKLIKDVTPSRLDCIRKQEQEISNLVDDKYGRDKNLKIDLEQIWGCIPIKNDNSSTSRYLSVIDSIFSGNKIDYNFLINQFTETIRIIKFERYGYNIWNKDGRYQPDFTNKILQLNFLLLFFKKLDILGGVNMNKANNMVSVEVEELLPKEILDYWNGIEIYNDEHKKALFSLGYLIGVVGYKQSNAGHKKKPILNKINFQGMGPEKLIRLSNDVLEKLRQYDKLQYNESIYSAIKLLMDRNISQWKLSNQENVFYVLSGYAFSNYMMRKRSKDKYFEELNEKTEYIRKAKDEGKNTEKEDVILKDVIELGNEYKYSNARKLLENIKISNKDTEVE